MKRHGVVLALAGLGMVANAGDASACGGDFSPPTTVQVVTDHRMVFSLSSAQTTLWDQFDYTGTPSDFSWILPLHYSIGVHVEIATEAFMQMADNLTAPQVVTPQRPEGGCFDDNGGPGAAGGMAAADAGVTVDLTEVVGPYDVAIISGTDPAAIGNWLSSHGYAVPPSVTPVIAYYTSLNMDYVALRLRPSAGINQMSPVRITMPGYQPTLPLRMISAGVSDKVGLSLIVLAPSRMEVQGFPNGQITSDELTYDFNNPTNPATDFINAFNTLNTAQGGRLWLTESATTQSAANWASQVAFYAMSPGGTGLVDAGSPGDAGPVANPADDVSTAFASLGASAVVTRLRASLGASALSTDLTLQASDQGLLGLTYTYGHVHNTPPAPVCPVDDAGTVVGLDAGVDAGSADGGATAPPPITPSGSETTGGIHCTAAPWATGSPRDKRVAFGLFAGLAMAFAARRRSRR